MSGLFSAPPPPPPVVLPPPPPPPQPAAPMPDLNSPTAREAALQEASQMGGSREMTNMTGEGKRKKLGVGGGTVAGGAAAAGSDAFNGSKLGGA